MQKFNGSLIRQFPSLVSGNAASGVQVTIYISGTNTLATIYEDNEVTPKGNPLTTASNGFYSFKAADGKYRLQFSSSQFPSLEIQLVDVYEIRQDFLELEASNDLFKDEQQAAYDAFVLSQGWQQAGAFAAGFTYASANQVGQDADGNWWRWNGALPKTVTAGTLPSSDANYKLVGDGVLRSELGRFFFTADSLGSLIASVNSTFEDKKVQWLGRDAISDGGSGWGVVRVGSYTADGGSIIAVGPNLYIEQNLKGQRVSVKKFGAKGDGTTDDTQAIQNCWNWCAPYTWKGSVINSRLFDPVRAECYFPSGQYRTTAPLLINPFLKVSGVSSGGFFGENNSTIWADFNGASIIDTAPMIAGGARPVGQKYTKEDFDTTVSIVPCPGWVLQDITLLAKVGRTITYAVNRAAAMQSHMLRVGTEGRSGSSFIGFIEVGIRTNLCWGGSIKSCHVVANTYALENNGDVTVDYQTGNYLVALGINSTYADLSWPDNDAVKAMTACVFNRFASPTLIGNTYEGAQIGIKSSFSSFVHESGGFFESLKEYAFAFHTVGFNVSPKWLLVPKKVFYKKDAAGSFNIHGCQYFDYLAGSFMDEVIAAPLYFYAPIALKEHYASIVYPELHASECNVYASSSGSDNNSGYRPDAPVLTLQEAALRCVSGKKSKINLLSNIATKYNVAGSNTTVYSFDNIGDLTIDGNGFTVTVSQSSNQCHALRLANAKLVTEDLNINLPTVGPADQRAFIRPAGMLNALLRNTDVTGTGTQSALFGSQDGVGGFLSVNILDSALSNFKLVQDTLSFTSSALMWMENNSGTTWSSVVTDSAQKIKSKQFP